MAHARGQPSNPQIAVLTGMPVSGMAYLDRPSEAGYFIFPDLSVRHEGKYRLVFNLYEETKEDRDRDAEGVDGRPPLPGGPNAPSNAFDWRLAVDSMPFTVFSAKKFPGLAESTVLSRTVAEQGCRVRIRRDVRMRRRDDKAAGYDEYDQEAEYTRARRTATPEERYSRQRSLSNTSVDRAQYMNDGPRRSSVSEYPPPYQQAYTPSPVAQQAPPPGGFLAFGQSTAPQYAAPPQAYGPPPPAPAQAAMHAPSYQQAPMPYPPQQYRRPSSAGHPYPERQAYPPYQPPVASGPRYDDYRRSSVGTGYTTTPGSTSVAHYPTVDPTYGSRAQPAQSYQPYPPRATTPNLPPVLPALKVPAMEPRYGSISSPAGPPPTDATHSNQAASYDSSRPGSSYQAHQPLAPASADYHQRAQKRSFDSVFSSVPHSKALHNGQRPASSYAEAASHFDDDDKEEAEAMFRMQYKRADGTEGARPLPSLF